MSRFHFNIEENGRLFADEEGLEFFDDNRVRKEAIATGASVARDAFVTGTACRVVVDVREHGAPSSFLKVSITLDVEEKAEG